jgi:hypothetical protein
MEQTQLQNLPPPDGKKEETPTVQLADRTAGLGAFAVLEDSLILKIFTLFSISELILLSSLSQVFYTLVNQDHIWKPLCLDKHGGDFRYLGSWKFTTLFYNNKKKTTPPPVLTVKGKLSEFAVTIRKDFCLTIYTQDGFFLMLHLFSFRWTMAPSNASLVKTFPNNNLSINSTLRERLRCLPI